MNSDKWVSLDELPEGLLRQLAYPSHDLNRAKELWAELRSLGVEELSTIDGKLRLLGKGYRSVVLRCRMGNKTLAAKVLRSDSPLKDVRHEAKMQIYANEASIGPRLIGHADHVIVMEEVEGVGLSDWLMSLRKDDFDRGRKLMTDLLIMARKLDQIGLRHGEISDARKHVIVSMGRPVIIDFSASCLRERPSNVTAIISYLFRGEVLPVVTSLLMLRMPSKDVLRRYKVEHSDGSFKWVLDELFGSEGV